MTRSSHASAGFSESSLLDAAFNRVGQHPRLLANTEKFSALREQLRTDPVSARIFAHLKNLADGMLVHPVTEYKLEGRRLLYVSRKVQGMVFTLALLSRLTDDPRYAQRAVAEMRAVSDFPDWNPKHFLDVAEMTLGIAIGYDWLFDQLNSTDRELFADAILKFGLRPSFDSPKEWLGWVDGTNNWTQVCHAGMVAGAVAIAEREPELARQAIERALKYLPHSAEAYAPDGAYPEGPEYWEYGTTFHVILVDTLEHFTGSTLGTDAYPGFLASADYMVQVIAPSGRFFSYADCRPACRKSITRCWFAKRLKRADLLRGTIHIQPSIDPTDGMAVESARHLALAMLWRDPMLQAEATTPSLSWKGGGSMPVAVHRTGWDNRLATFIGIKGGSADLPHAHMDVGSFVLEADGVRWAVDPGPQDYHSLEQCINLWDRSQGSERWSAFRLGPEAHNILRFNQAPQQVDGQAISFKFSKSHASTIFDLTAIYSKQVTAVRRGSRLLENGCVLIQDEWTAGEASVEVTWQMLTQAETVTVENEKVRLESDGKSLVLHVLHPGEVKILIEDKSQPIAPYDVANPGLKRIIITAQSQAYCDGRFLVLAQPGSVTDLTPVQYIPLADWPGDLL